jgi:hypothetical protein
LIILSNAAAVRRCQNERGLVREKQWDPRILSILVRDERGKMAMQGPMAIPLGIIQSGSNLKKKKKGKKGKKKRNIGRPGHHSDYRSLRATWSDIKRRGSI